MIIKQASVYTQEEKWQTICCDNASQGRKCTICGQRPPMKYVNSKENGLHQFVYQEDQTKRILSFTLTKLSVHQDRIETKKDEYSMQLIFKKENGFLALNTPLGMMSFSKEHRGTISKFLDLLMGLRKGLLTRFLRLCFRDRGIHYRKPEDFYESYYRWDYLAELLQAPELQHIALTAIPVLNEEERQAIRHETKGKRIMKTLIGHSNSDFLRICQEHMDHYYKVKTWSPYFKKIDNARRVLEALDGKIGIVYNPLRQHAKDLRFFHKGMKLLTSLHQEETVWANRLLTLLTNHDTISYPVEIIGDIARMSENIWEEVPDYVLPFNGKMEELHDKLAKDHTWLVNVKKIVYRYSDEKKWEQQVKHYTFQLAKDSVELSKIGSEMNICVGSYNNQIIEGETKIVWMKKPDAKHVDVCIEIQQGMVVQAKMKHNDLPGEDLCFVVQEWAANCGLEIVTNDIRI